MSELELSPEHRAYRPGETIRVQVRWTLPQPPHELILNLLWYTKGKGDEDVQVVTGETLTEPGASGQREFSLLAPAHPPSFSGTLITLTWALELLSEPHTTVVREVIVIAPDASELLLGEASGSG